ncbi:MAG TPA: hypothetical protein VFH06_01605 [Candidatus Saccharimonadales bacterium]|nr:hypothetical protein [Candidatus Saccharimonadales bacterium]
MDTIDLGQEIGRELFIVSESGTVIHLQLLNLDRGKLAVCESFCVRILEITPPGTGYVVGEVAAFAAANREGMEVDDIKSTADILRFSSTEIAPGYFGLLTQGALDRCFKVKKVELR